MKLLAILVGKPQEMVYQGHSVSSAINKKEIQGPVMVGILNLDGDQQADLKVHGGRDKAVYAYSFDAYEKWQELRPQNQFPYGAMGENFVIDHFQEDQVYLGDIYQIGGAVIQVTQPRYPCQKLAIKYADPQILKQFVALNRAGVYFRVLQEGMVGRGQSLKLIEQEETKVSVAEFFALTMSKTIEIEKLKQILQIKSLNEILRKEVEMMLAQD